VLFRRRCEKCGKQIRRHFTTFPIATAVWIGLILHRLSGKTWIVDFPRLDDRRQLSARFNNLAPLRWLEGQAILRASLLLFTAESAIRMYRQRYPHLPARNACCFPTAMTKLTSRNCRPPHSHAQIRAVRFSCYIPVWSTRRSAIHDLFSAHRRATQKDGQVKSRHTLRELSCARFEQLYSKTSRNWKLETSFTCSREFPTTRRSRVCGLDALLLMQAKNCITRFLPRLTNTFAWEANSRAYHGNGRHRISLETGRRRNDYRFRDEHAMRADCLHFIQAVQESTHQLPSAAVASHYSRRNLTRELANHLNQLKPQNL